MTFKTPFFWYRKTDQPAPLIERLLTPLSALYNAGQTLNRQLKTPQKTGIPVICIGNLTAGGSGKTPTAIAVLTLIKDKKLAETPVFLTRGYGGKQRGPLMVDPQIHTYKDVGDEALLLAAHAPTIVSANRAEGAELAEKEGADVIIMDDGLQNYDLAQDLKIMVIDGTIGLGNKKLLPAGPLREPLKPGLAKADLFVIIGTNKREIDYQPQAQGTITAIASKIENRPYVAFSGLGYPEKFFEFLKNDLGLKIISTKIFPDHHPYTDQDLEDLQQKATAQNATLITTEKDAVRLPHTKDVQDIQTVPVKLVWEDETPLLNGLKSILKP